jgi:hypothetical protein
VVLKLSGTHQLPIYVDGVNLLGDNTNKKGNKGKAIPVTGREGQ